MILLLVAIFFTVAIGDCVVVTGATGFVAGHVIEVLFQKGYVVHGTVRDPSNEKKTSFLRELEAKYDAKLNLFKADLLEPNAFDLAVEGCSGFFHVASPVMQGGMNNQRMVDLAVEGTLSALTAAHKAKVKTMIITSSVASISQTKAKVWTRLEDCKSPYDETDWNDVSTLEDDAYGFSKVQAERATNEWMSMFDTPPFRLATMHFPVAFGPQQSTRVTSSNLIVQTTIRGEFPFTLPFYLNVVDIRDVARAHVHLFEHEKATGRYIVSIDQQLSSKSWLDVSHDILEADDLKSLPVATFVLPPWVISLSVWLQLDKRLSKAEADEAHFGGPTCGYDGSKITSELGFEYKYTDSKRTIQETARSMLRLGIVDGKRQMVEIVKVLCGLVFVAVLMVVVLCYCCCRRSKDKKD